MTLHGIDIARNKITLHRRSYIQTKNVHAIAVVLHGGVLDARIKVAAMELFVVSVYPPAKMPFGDTICRAASPPW